MKQREDGVEGTEGTRKYVRRKTGAGSQGEEIADPLEPPPLKVWRTRSSGVSLFSRQRRAIAHGNPPRSNLALRFDSEDISDFVLRNT